MKKYFLVLAIFLALPTLSPSQDEAPLKLVQSIKLPGLKEGDFDHFAADRSGNRLFLTAEKNAEVEVLDHREAVGKLRTDLDALAWRRSARRSSGADLQQNRDDGRNAKMFGGHGPLPSGIRFNGWTRDRRCES